MQLKSFKAFNEGIMKVSLDYDPKMTPEQLVHQRIQRALKQNDGFTRGHIGHALELYAERADVDKVNEVIKDYELDQKFGMIMVKNDRSGRWETMTKKADSQPNTEE
jgi:hypothetical protein